MKKIFTLTFSSANPLLTILINVGYKHSDLLLYFQYFVLVAENYVYGDVKFLLSQYPRFVPQSAPDFLQTFVVKRIKAKLTKQAIAQGIGRHSRYNNSAVFKVAFTLFTDLVQLNC